MLANSIEILPSTSESITTDVNGIFTNIPKTFSVNIGDDKSDIPKSSIYVCRTRYKGGPFNAIPFDPLTGQPHQGRIAKGTISPIGFTQDNAIKEAEILK